MSVTAMVVVTASIFVWGTLSGRLERADLTAPIVFMGLGAWQASARWTLQRHRSPSGLWSR